MDAHCDRCEAYEAQVMAGEPNPDAAPCDDYEMTEPFKQWMVDRLRDDVMGQINSAGLNRMTILKDDQKAD
ncbi:MAG: hypothetical protein ACPHID_05025 [Thermoplasmatota archaeon]